MRSLLIGVVLLGVGAPALACGDKFLVPSEAGVPVPLEGEIRILLFTPSGASEDELSHHAKIRGRLEDAGYAVVTVHEEDTLAESIESRSFALVLTSNDAAETIASLMAIASPESVLVPVVSKSRPDKLEEARREYRRVLRMPSRSARIVAVVENAIAERPAG